MSNTAIVRRIEAWDIAEHWPGIRQLATVMFTPARGITDDDLTELVAKLSAGVIHCWLAGTGDHPSVMLLTCVETEPLFNKRFLNVLAMSADTRDVPLSVFGAVRDALLKYAKGRGCEFMTTVAIDDRVVRLVKRYGGKQLPVFSLEV